MNLSDMAEFVCAKVRQTDSVSIARCKEFLARRYELVYNDALWRDSLYLFGFTFTPNGTKPESWDSTFLMPAVVDKVVAIRTATQEIAASGQDVLMRGSIDQFSQTGDPVTFATLAPCVAYFPDAFASHQAALLQGNPADVGSPITADYIDSTGARSKFTGTLSTAVVISDDARVVERITKPVTVATVGLFELISDTLVALALAGDTSFPARLPVRFLPGPTTATTMKALVKKAFIELDADGDTPELRNVTDVLIAFAQADMLERARQYAKASGKFQEAGSMLDQLKQMHTWQEQTLVSLTPDVSQQAGDVGYGLLGKNFW